MERCVKGRIWESLYKSETLYFWLTTISGNGVLTASFRNIDMFGIYETFVLFVVAQAALCATYFYWTKWKKTSIGRMRYWLDLAGASTVIREEDEAVILDASFQNGKKGVVSIGVVKETIEINAVVGMNTHLDSDELNSILFELRKSFQDLGVSYDLPSATIRITKNLSRSGAGRHSFEGIITRVYNASSAAIYLRPETK